MQCQCLSQAPKHRLDPGQQGIPKRFAKEIAEGVKRASDLMGQLALDALRQHIDEMVPRVRQVMKQTRARIYRGETRADCFASSEWVLACGLCWPFYVSPSAGFGRRTDSVKGR